jgi:hypothetical protein
MLHTAIKNQNVIAYLQNFVFNIIAMSIRINRWRTVHNEGLRTLYFSQTIIQNYKIKEDEMVGAFDTHGKHEKYDAVVRKPEVQNRMRVLQVT